MTDRQEAGMEDLERMAARMAQAIPELECPEQCELGSAYYYVERCTVLYQDEYEWACLVRALLHYRRPHADGAGRQG